MRILRLSYISNGKINTKDKPSFKSTFIYNQKFSHDQKYALHVRDLMRSLEIYSLSTKRYGLCSYHYYYYLVEC